MFGNSRLKKIIESSFGHDPQRGIYYYNAQNRLKDVRILHDGMSAADDGSWEIDDITWDDLEMDRVFLRINHTNSFVGEQTLYHKLHVLDKGRNEVARELTELRLEYLEAHPKERLEMEMRLCSLGKASDGYQLTDFMLNTDVWKIGNTVVYHILQLILVVMIVLTIIFHNPVVIFGMVASALVNLFVYIFTKQKYDMYLGSLGDFKRIYEYSKWMDNHFKHQEIFVPDAVKVALGNLAVMSKAIVGLNNKRQNSMSGDAIAMMFDYVWGIFLIDISAFNYIMKGIEKNLDDVFLLIDYVGEIDSEISILSYRKSIEKWCRPEFGDGELTYSSEKAYGSELPHGNDSPKKLVGKNILHPLIKNPVGNDFSMTDRVVITGANASGKSTFMKSVAINAILAQSINTCIADEFALQPMQIVTCMALRDDVLSGESYYFREAKYLKRMLDLIDREDSVMIVIDEILKGTNTKERVAASKAIMNYISAHKCAAMVATHDNELTESGLYQKFYFTSTMKDNDIVFDYRIHEGNCAMSNAIALLDFLGYPSDIVAEARGYVGDEM